MIELYKAVTSK